MVKMLFFGGEPPAEGGSFIIRDESAPVDYLPPSEPGRLLQFLSVSSLT